MNYQNKKAIPLVNCLFTCLLVLFMTVASVSALPIIGFPDADPRSGRFINVTRGLSSLGDATDNDVINIELEIHKSLPAFTLKIFDGDLAQSGQSGYTDGNDNPYGQWDVFIRRPGDTTPLDDIVFLLYRDPMVVSNTDPIDLVYAWESSGMPNDDWCVLTPIPNSTFGAPIPLPDTCDAAQLAKIPQDPGALDGRPDSVNTGNYYYHLVAKWKTQNFLINPGGEQNNFKVAVEGQPFLRAGSTIGFIGYGPNDPMPTYFPPTIFDGNFGFKFRVDDPGIPVNPFNLWDGDFDHWNQDGIWNGGVTENDDANTPEYPPFSYATTTVPEGANPGQGPQDGFLGSLQIGGTPYYDISHPNWPAPVVNTEPSGDLEWERFMIATPDYVPTDAGTVPDVIVDKIYPGYYDWRLYDIDGRNTLFIHADYEMVPLNEDCGLELTKTCEVAAGEGDWLCVSAIASTTLKYTGPDIADATVVFDGDKAGYAEYNGPLLNGTVLTDSSQNGWTIDSPGLGARTTITITDNSTGIDYVEIIHTSCSAVYEAALPAPLDANSPNPSGVNIEKGDPSPTWFVEKFLDKDGTVVDPPDVGPANICNINGSTGEVTYAYTVKNTGTSTVGNICIQDDKLGEITTTDFILAPGDERHFEVVATISKNTYNLATATGTMGSVQCLASDFARVTIAEVTIEPVECIALSGEFKKRDDKIEWGLRNDGSDPISVDSITIAWPLAHNKLEKIQLERKTIWDEDIYSSPVTIDNFIGDPKHLRIEPGKEKKLKIEFDKKTKSGAYEITVNFAEGCSVIYKPGVGGNFDCDKPIDVLTMIWNGSDGPVFVKAWKGSVGSELLGGGTLGPVYPGQELTVSGYAGSPNDVYWEIFDVVGDKIGESTFHMSCSDAGMNGPEDCGMPEGDGKDMSGYLNDWLLEGMVDSRATLDCLP